jgi:hypothetical protein
MEDTPVEAFDVLQPVVQQQDGIGWQSFLKGQPFLGREEEEQKRLGLRV